MSPRRSACTRCCSPTTRGATPGWTRAVRSSSSTRRTGACGTPPGSSRRPRLRPALRLGPPGPYVLQAAIAVEHANAPTAAATRWDHIAALYARLAALRRDPVVELNRAVAIAMTGDVSGGLRRLDALAPELDRYH